MMTIDETAGGDAISEALRRVPGERLLICREGRPVAAVVSLEEIEELDRLRAALPPGSLASLVGQWPGYDEIEGSVEEAYSRRGIEQPRPHWIDTDIEPRHPERSREGAAQ
jgi:antitoxin (DNA-binding transcriptional repressor) of toxin-antitoxin stability system